MRPLFFDYPNDPAAHEIEDQFLFGSEIIFAPIMKYGVRSRPVYLPEGQTWTNAYTKHTYEGGQLIMCEAPIEYSPVFIRNSSNKLLDLF